MVADKKIKAVLLGSSMPTSASAHASYTNKFEQGIHEDASSLVIGGIVEKNLSSKLTSTPAVTVLPFPVARHRSSGPHWKHVSVDVTAAHEEDSDDIINIDSVSSFANPVQRKQKNAVNLKRWGQHVLDSQHLDSEKIGEEDYAKQSKCLSESRKCNDESLLGIETKEVLSSISSLTSLQCDIDSENQLRLQEMSAEEITEAQAELKEKMNPSLIDFLRRRGHSKQRNVSAVDPNSRQYFDAESDKLRSGVSNDENLCLSSSTYCIPQTIHEHKNKSIKHFNYASSTSWNSWSRRVEAVRYLRFSLEGTVISDNLDADYFPLKSGMGAENVGERDILRSEGDPAAAGYTIQEAVQLTRSVIPGQRSIALHLLASLLNRAICGLQNCGALESPSDVKPIDWEAIWAYALGPEPELALSLRLCLDDNHNLVVFTCAKAIYSALTCDLNEHFFDASEKVGILRDLYTAPIFRSKPEIETGFVRAGFWKLSAKPSTILNASDEVDEDETEKHTIREDVVIAGQDFAAGLVKMGLIQKLQYLLENNPSASMEEYIVCIFVSIARHSQTCANAVLRYPGLIKLIVERFQVGVFDYTNYGKISSVVLLKVLAKADQKNCSELWRNGYFQIMASNLFHPFASLNDWMNLGKVRGKFYTKLMVEQLRYWKACINNGFGVSYFQSIFSTVCLWLARPSLNSLLDYEFFPEFASVSAEAFLVLCSLARRLPNLYCQGNINGEDAEGTEEWSWSYVAPLVDLAISWFTFKNDPYLWNILAGRNDDKTLQCSFLWLLSSVFHFLSTLFQRLTPEEDSSNAVPWLPEFVPQVGLEILKQRFLSCPNETESTFVQLLCYLRDQDDDELSLASTSCLSSLLFTVSSVDNLIKSCRSQTQNALSTYSSLEAKLLEDGIQNRCFLDLKCIFDSVTSKISSRGLIVQSIEAFGRGGPAPGVGIGWGVPRGGFWSTKFILMRQESEILFHILSRAEDSCGVDSDFHWLNLNLEICLTFGAGDRASCGKVFDCLFGVSVLKQLGSRVQDYFRSSDSPVDLGYTEEDYAMFSRRLSYHYSNFWLPTKRKGAKDSSSSLTTINENAENSDCSVETLEWANQRLPLPLHWLCSSVAISPKSKHTSDANDVFQESNGGNETAKCGLFLLLGVEILSSAVSDGIRSHACSIPLIWKLHSLSASLLSGMSVLEDDKSRAVFEALQDMYSVYLDNNMEIMRYQSEIHGNYGSFVETLVEQFSAESYGDVVFGRQVAIYLQSRVEAPVKFAAWNALSSGRALDILPPLDKCMGKAHAYLSPVEDSDTLLEAYVKSWTSGALDRAVIRGSMAFSLAVHHISSFVFAHSNRNLSFRNKLLKYLLRDCAVSPKRQEMVMYLIRYSAPSSPRDDVDIKFRVLVEACDNESSLLLLVKKLRSNID